ncbi:MAG: HD domain-containing protein, partial [Planctomycetaceae bacterium]
MSTDIDRDELIRLTEEHGGQWGLNHTRRLLHLVSHIGEGQAYNADAVWVAAHLHDWGAYAPWAQKGVDHVVRSLQVADTFLTEKGYPEDFKRLVLECIEYHHGTGSDDRSTEALLMRDADVLDFLGVVGILRDFSKNPKG